MSKTKKILPLMLVGIWIIQTVSCNSTGDIYQDESEVYRKTLQAGYATETAQTEATADAEAAKKIPLIVPGEPPEPDRTLKDFDSSIRASENRAVSGDNFFNSLYERPFTSQEMIYQPDLDIYTVDFAYDKDFFYFRITLHGLDPDDWALTGMYGVEFDRTKTGRGDLIVWVENPQEDWSAENVSVYTDKNGDVGGPNPMIANADFEGDGYDTPVELVGSKFAFARLASDEPEAIQIAVSRNLLENPTEFLWSAWADNGLKNAAMFDYNDTMGLSEAGSPIKGDKNYPLAALYSLDNTCRLPYGFEQIGAFIRGMCDS